MTIRDRLNALDRRLLPPITAVLDRLARGARRVRFLRVAVPIVGVAVVLGALYAAGKPPAVVPGPIGTSVRLGVAEGDSIPAYVATSNADLATLAAASNGTTPSYYALVSLSHYLTPAQLTALLAGVKVQVTEVIMRVPSARQTQIVQLPVTSLPDQLERGMRATADLKRQAAVDDVAQLADVVGNSKTDAELRAQYTVAHSVDTLEADRYRALCGCAYGVVVYGSLSALAQLDVRSGVRAIEARILTYPNLAVFVPPFPDQSDRAEPPPSSGP